MMIICVKPSARAQVAIVKMTVVMGAGCIKELYL